MSRTSNKSEKILQFVQQFTVENGYSPSVREIGAAVGLSSTATVSYHLRQLQEKGLLQIAEGKGRKRTVVAAQRSGYIPIVGVVTAGVPILAVENREGMMAWDGDPECFALRVRGDSMIGAGILDGDKVVIRPQQTAEDGQIGICNKGASKHDNIQLALFQGLETGVGSVVARIEDEATVKRLSRRDNQVWLLPENPAYDPIDGSQAELIGLVKAVVREY